MIAQRRPASGDPERLAGHGRVAGAEGVRRWNTKT